MTSRLAVVGALEGLAHDALLRIGADYGTAVTDVPILARSKAASSVSARNQTTTQVMSGSRDLSGRRNLAQFWAILSAVHSSLSSASKLTQRELWYRLKTSGLFDAPRNVQARLLDLQAAVSHRLGAPCAREDLGIVAAPRGSITGCLTVVPREAATPPPSAPVPADSSSACLASTTVPRQPLHATIFQIPGDTEVIRALEIAASPQRALCVLVVEKDSVFRRLVDDRFIARLPCVLVTACGFPDLATRILVRRVVDALQLRCFALTDYNPHGLALMLAYKHGSDKHVHERNACCPSLEWIGVRSDHIAAEGHILPRPRNPPPLPLPPSPPDQQHRHQRRRFDETPFFLPADAKQPFTARDKALLNSMSQRPEVATEPALLREIERMHENAFKVEIEALHCHGCGYLASFLESHLLTALEQGRQAVAMDGDDAMDTDGHRDDDDDEVGDRSQPEDLMGASEEGAHFDFEQASSSGEDAYAGDLLDMDQASADEPCSAQLQDSDDEFWQMGEDDE